MADFTAGLLVGVLVTALLASTALTAVLLVAFKPWRRWPWWERRAARVARAKLHRQLRWHPSADSGVLPVPPSLVTKAPTKKRPAQHDPISDIDTLVI